MNAKTLDNATIRDVFGDDNLAAAIIEQIGDWDAFKESASSIAFNGCRSGFSGFIYTTEILEFFHSNKMALAQFWDSVDDTYKGNLVLPCVIWLANENADQFHEPITDLVWFAVEYYAYKCVEKLED
jgi:hypothetical protein